MERDMIEKTLHICDGNMSVVAEKLGVTRQTLYNKLKKYNL
jgi:DNA-binding NtrC family response regulator